ncbi:C-C motif chemokine 21 [Paramuricea clavata]|uniref:C-C motif chemokine 21 n=1 Tax=Paramuricea clavata TaxID=317549 RepID=A0A6S7IAS4_PARCT|nr:C-C motif chemokine 21 [Paramuricea clavata]
MAETSSDCGRKKAKVDGSLDGSSASSRKFDGAARFKSKFQPSWSKKWPCIIAVPRSPTEFRCMVCDKVCSCAHQGESDVTRHIQGEKHQKNVRARTNAAPVKFIWVYFYLGSTER